MYILFLGAVGLFCPVLDVLYQTSLSTLLQVTASQRLTLHNVQFCF